MTTRPDRLLICPDCLERGVIGDGDGDLYSCTRCLRFFAWAGISLNDARNRARLRRINPDATAPSGGDA